MNKPIRQATLLFLLDKSIPSKPKILLAMKKRGFGKGRWNGPGGKVIDGESVRNAVKREAMEEVSITPSHMKKSAELVFRFSNNPDWDQVVHVYTACLWKGEPKESDEMSPRWFKEKDIPYELMWEDDKVWLPHVLSGKFVNAEFTFDQNDKIISQKIKLK